MLVRRHDVILNADTSGEPVTSGFDEFFESRRARCLRLAHLITGSATVGQDVVQNAFLAVHAKWDSIDNHDAYLRAAVVNLSRSVQRRQIRERLHLSREGDTTTSIPDVDETWIVIRRLPADQRAVLVLRFYEDLSLADIATVIDKPLGTVKSTLHRALARMKENLHD